MIPGLGLAHSLLALAALLAIVAVSGDLLRALSVCRDIGAWIQAAAVWYWTRGRSKIGVVESLYGQFEVRTSEIGSTLLIDGLPQTGLPKRLAPGDSLEYGYLLELSLANASRTKGRWSWASEEGWPLRFWVCTT